MMFGFFKKKKKKKIVIGIHGLGNKPPEKLLYDWWLKSIKEGLAKINRGNLKFEFELVYWANIMHPEPLDPDETDKEAELFLDEKYVPEVNASEVGERTFQQNMVEYFREQLNKIIFNEKLHVNYPAATDLIIKLFFKELAVYFTENCSGEGLENCLIREIIQEKLMRVIEKHADKKILLIAHSMGTIVAYDVLMNIEEDGIGVNTLLSCASPLGVPFIYNKIKHERGFKNKALVPNSIKNKWFNLADLNDKIAVNYELNKLFEPNKYGVFPVPTTVVNNYEFNGIKNPHKSYGYLRTKETAKIIANFLIEEEKTEKINNILSFAKNYYYKFKGAGK